MNPDLEKDRTLLGRFVLTQCVRSDVASQLWFADDLHLATGVLLQICAGSAQAGNDRFQSLTHRVRSFRHLRHPHIARVHDLHEGDGLLVVSMDATAGELLSYPLRRAGPMGYDFAVERMRPLIEALLHAHESGCEHGCLDVEHILVDGDRWLLLPDDGSQPTRSDMSRLGQFIADLLTGGRAPERGRQLNDVPDRLHEGRTIPALLNQLVTDLRESDADLQPTGMREVLSRLDQIERFLRPESQIEGSAPTSPETLNKIASPELINVPTGESGARRPVAKLMWLVAPVVIVCAVVAIAFAVQNRPQRDVASDDEATQTPQDENVGNIEPAPGQGSTPLDSRQVAREKADADEALNQCLAVRREVESIGAKIWASEHYETAVGLSDRADRSYLDQQYATAAAQYRDATSAMQELVASSDDALNRVLEEGGIALDVPDAASAMVAFQTALLIDPGNRQAEIGLQRANTVDEVHRLLALGRSHENKGQLALAKIDFESAAALDAHSREAAESLERVAASLAGEVFQDKMSEALVAYHAGQFAAARAHLLDVQSLRPEAREVAQALVMVENAQRRARMEQLQADGRALEDTEQWQDAWNVYRQALAIDPSVEFAQDGKARSETMIRLETHTSRFLTDPDLLMQRGSREDAVMLVKELDNTPNKGPRLQQMQIRLAEQVVLANTLHPVTLLSDGDTNIDVYRVGRYETFQSLELELLPGEYTVIGHRAGYRDVRLTLRIDPGNRNTMLTVICTERVR